MNAKKIRRHLAMALAVAAVQLTANAVDVSTAQELVDAVNNNAADGTEIVLAKGTYDLSGVTTVTAVGHMYAQKSVKLRGATGNPADVIVRGDGQNRIIYFYKAGNEVRDITFTNGNANYDTNTSTEPKDTSKGGAICFRQETDDSLVSNCVFTANTAKGGGGAVGEYAAWAGGNLASGRLIDCVFTDNTAASNGGAVAYPALVLGCAFTNNVSTYQWGHGGAVLTARRVENCYFHKNGLTSGSQGGALKIALDKAGEAVVVGCTFTENATSTYGGAIVADSSVGFAALVTNCTFVSNGKSTMTEGGAVHGVSNVVDCVFVGNQAKSGGAAAWSILRDCTLCGNVATEKGGAAYMCGLDFCTVATNTATLYGGGAYQSDCAFLITNCTFEANASPSGGALYGATNVVDSTIVSNTADYGGGVAYSAVRGGCRLISNVATQFGGGLYISAAENCLVASNSADYGGGAYALAKEVPPGPIVGCRFVGNEASSSGGGLYQCNQVFGCEFRGNRGSSGGAAYKSTMTGCLCVSNVCTSTSGGGACHTCTLFFCTNTANSCSSATGGDGSATELRESSAEDCVFSHVGETVHPIFVRSRFNRCRFDSLTNNANFGAFNWESSLTNCLVTHANVKCLFRVNLYDNHNSALVNCTFADNCYAYFNNVSKADGIKERIDVVNCFFSGNTDRTAGSGDFDSYVPYLVREFRNCIFASKDASWAPGETSLNTYGNPAFRPGFVGAEADPENPYALKRSSPAVRRGGHVMDWMANTTDIRGEGFPRLRDGRVHIGCYQCWLDPSGVMLLLR